MPRYAPQRSPLVVVAVAFVFLFGAGLGVLAAFSEGGTATPATKSGTEVASNPTAKPSTVPVATSTIPTPKKSSEATTAAVSKKPDPVKTPAATPATTPAKSATPATTPAKTTEPATTKKPDEPPMKVTFDKVLPIFKSSCNTCHGDPQKKADLDLRTLASAMKGSTGGKVVVPGDLKASGLWQSIEAGEMPPPGKTPLTNTEKNLIKNWIMSGAK